MLQEPVYEEVISRPVEERVVLENNVCYSQTQGAVAQPHEPEYEVVIETNLNEAYGNVLNQDSQNTNGTQNPNGINN